MTNIRALTQSLAVLSLAGLVAAAPAARAGSAATAAHSAKSPAAAPASTSSWRVRTVLRERPADRIASQVVGARAAADYTLVSATTSLVTGPYRLRRTDLATGSVRRGPEFPVSGLSLAAGYLWVSGSVPPLGASVALVLYQVNPRTLAVVRSWRLTPRRRPGFGMVEIAAGQARTVWVGFRRTVLRIDTGTGATTGRVSLHRGLFFSDVAASPARRRLYVSAGGIRSGGGDVFEYAARSRRLIASTGRKPLPSVAGAQLTAVPGGVWASFRTGMLGQTVLLSRTGLTRVRLSGGVYTWSMTATTVYGGGALWLVNGNNVIGCIAPGTGVVRHQRTFAGLGNSGELLAVNAVLHVIYALGSHGVIAITPPRNCWGDEPAGAR